MEWSGVEWSGVEWRCNWWRPSRTRWGSKSLGLLVWEMGLRLAVPVELGGWDCAETIWVAVWWGMPLVAVVVVAVEKLRLSLLVVDWKVVCVKRSWVEGCRGDVGGVGECGRSGRLGRMQLLVCIGRGVEWSGVE